MYAGRSRDTTPWNIGRFSAASGARRFSVTSPLAVSAFQNPDSARSHQQSHEREAASGSRGRVGNSPGT